MDGALVMESRQHWSQDSYWTDALKRYHAAKEQGVSEMTISLGAIEGVLFDGDGPAYRALEAMTSVQEHEGYEGFRGAPRVVLALLQILSEQSPDLIRTSNARNAGVAITVKPRRKKLELPTAKNGTTPPRKPKRTRPTSTPKSQRVSALSTRYESACAPEGRMIESLREAQKEGEFGGLRTVKEFAKKYPRKKGDKKRRKIDIMDKALPGGAPGLKSQR
jgi:hypothetical protein